MHYLRKCFKILFYEAVYSVNVSLWAWLGRVMVLGNFQCRGILLVWIVVGHRPTLLAVGAGAVVGHNRIPFLSHGDGPI